MEDQKEYRTKAMEPKTGIGFRNFRRFENFPLLEFGEITYMVGRNNSGKSTMVKALLLVLDYLNNQTGRTFSFDNKSLEDANIVTFGRAKKLGAEDPFISFEVEIDNFRIDLQISGESDSTRANVDKLKIKDSKKGFTLIVDYQKKQVTLKSERSQFPAQYNFAEEKNFYEEYHNLQNAFMNLDEKWSEEGLRLADEKNKLQGKIESLKILKESSNEPTEAYTLTYPIGSDNSPRTEERELEEIVSLFIYQNTLAYKKLIEKRNKLPGDDEDEENFSLAYSDVLNLYTYRKDVQTWIEEFTSTINRKQFFYLGANPAKQSALFPLRAKENALAQAIHEFKQSGIKKGETEWEFVKTWMKKFEVGEDFEISFYAGEAYEFYVIADGEKTHLADKGMGSLQAMMLILRVASLIRRSKNTKEEFSLIVEEPELNLHPALQSKLTDFFHHVNIHYGFKFIVETHSEYMIRKTQLLGLQEDYFGNQNSNPNPFKVYYFHKEEGPYEMEYKKDSKFERSFAKGFFDVADELAIKTYKLNLKKNK